MLEHTEKTKLNRLKLPDIRAGLAKDGLTPQNDLVQTMGKQQIVNIAGQRRLQEKIETNNRHIIPSSILNLPETI